MEILLFEKVKPITENQLVELLPASADVVARACGNNLAVPVMYKGGEVPLKEALAEGWLTAECISVNGIPAYFVAFNKTFDGGLWVNVAQQLGNGDNRNSLFLGCEMIALRERCRYVRFTTFRRGLVKAAQGLGYHADAVLMTKGL